MQISLEANREAIPVSVMDDVQPDLTWNFTDAAGHTHCFNSVTGKVDSIESVKTGEWYCGDCREIHEEFELRCKACGEKVEPKYHHLGPATRTVPGLASYSVIVDGRTYDIDHSTYVKLIEANGHDELAQIVTELVLPR
jgi:hypothetical protein